MLPQHARPRPRAGRARRPGTSRAGPDDRELSRRRDTRAAPPPLPPRRGSRRARTGAGGRRLRRSGRAAAASRRRALPSRRRSGAAARAVRRAGPQSPPASRFPGRRCRRWAPPWRDDRDPLRPRPRRSHAGRHTRIPARVGSRSQAVTNRPRSRAARRSPSCAGPAPRTRSRDPATTASIARVADRRPRRLSGRARAKPARSSAETAEGWFRARSGRRPVSPAVGRQAREAPPSPKGSVQGALLRRVRPGAVRQGGFPPGPMLGVPGDRPRETLLERRAGAPAEQPLGLLGRADVPTTCPGRSSTMSLQRAGLAQDVEHQIGDLARPGCRSRSRRSPPRRRHRRCRRRSRPRSPRRRRRRRASHGWRCRPREP